MVRDIGFLVFPSFQILDLTGPVSVFEAPTLNLDGGGGQLRDRSLARPA